MKTPLFIVTFIFISWCSATAQKAVNPIIFADVPDLSIIRVGDSYYMSSTTMHMTPGVPIMKSTDLTNWKLVNYAYNTLDSTDELTLENGKSDYGRGSWASSLRYHNGTYYVSTFAKTTGKTYIFTTKNIEKGPWKTTSFKPALHDHSLFFDDDGKTYMVYGSGKIMLAELSNDLSGIKPNTQPKVIIENANTPTGNKPGLNAEGSQLFKRNGKYYLFNINWPKGEMRTVLVHRADNINGPYEGKIALQDRGIAQGGIINTTNDTWYAYLFRDYGAVGRIPYLVPVTWKDNWPVLGENGKAPDTLNLPENKGVILGIVASDEFDRKKNERQLPLAWQWNHNPDNKNWSVLKRPGYLRLITSKIDTSLFYVKNILTQRSFGPECNGIIKIDISGMKNGDRAGLVAFQQQYGWVGALIDSSGNKFIVMYSNQSGQPIETQRIRLQQNTLYVKIHCDFKERADKATFYYSLNGNTWQQIGVTLQMKYTIPHFMGYRFGLFNYATAEAGGFADFDFFRITPGS